jgi:hypothetical protein
MIPMETFLSAVFHCLNFASSQAAVTIWNHPYITTTSATKANIPNAQLISLCIISNVPFSASSCDCICSFEFEMLSIL